MYKLDLREIKTRINSLKTELSFRDGLLLFTTLIVGFLLVRELKTHRNSELLGADISSDTPLHSESNTDILTWNDPVTCENGDILDIILSHEIYPEHGFFLEVQKLHTFDSEFWNNQTENLSKYAHEAVSTLDEITCINPDSCFCNNGEPSVVDGVCRCTLCNPGFNLVNVGHIFNRFDAVHKLTVVNDNSDEVDDSSYFETSVCSVACTCENGIAFNSDFCLHSILNQLRSNNRKVVEIRTEFCNYCHEGYYFVDGFNICILDKNYELKTSSCFSGYSRIITETLYILCST